MEADFCVEALEDALARHGKPEIFNTDQGSQYQPRLLQRAAGGGDRHQHGRQGRVARQRLRRTAVAVGQVRGDLPAGLRHRQHGARLDQPVPRLLQWTKAPFEPGPAHPRPSLLQQAAASRGRLNPAGYPLIQAQVAVQTNRATSLDFWLARGAIALVAVLQLLVVNDLSFGPRWLAPALELTLLIPLSAATAWNQ